MPDHRTPPSQLAGTPSTAPGYTDAGWRYDRRTQAHHARRQNPLGTKCHRTTRYRPGTRGAKELRALLHQARHRDRAQDRLATRFGESVNAAAEIRTKRRKAQAPAYFVVRRMVDPNTGVEIGCLVPASSTDRAILREEGTQDRRPGSAARFRKPRNRAIQPAGAWPGHAGRQTDQKDSRPWTHMAQSKRHRPTAESCATRSSTRSPALGPDRSEPLALPSTEMDEGGFHVLERDLRVPDRNLCWPTIDQTRHRIP